MFSRAIPLSNALIGNDSWINKAISAVLIPIDNIYGKFSRRYYAGKNCGFPPMGGHGSFKRLNAPPFGRHLPCPRRRLS